MYDKYSSLQYQGETPLNYQHTFLKMKDRRVKQVLSREEYQWEGEGIRKG
jgi:hypothetical protein